VFWLWPGVKVMGKRGERRSWAPKKYRGAFLGHTQSNILGGTLFGTQWNAVREPP